MRPVVELSWAHGAFWRMDRPPSGSGGEMFQKNDLVVYGRTGVCRVMDITTPDFFRAKPGEEKKLYYMLKPLYQGGTIYAPMDNPKVLIRPILTAAEAKRLVDMIPTIGVQAYYGGSTQELRNHYQTLMQTSDCADLMELVMSIYAKKVYVEQTKRKFGAVDEHFMKEAEQLLNGELAASLDIPMNEVSDYIAAKVKARKAVPARGADALAQEV